MMQRLFPLLTTTVTSPIRNVSLVAKAKWAGHMTQECPGEGCGSRTRKSVRIVPHTPPSAGAVLTKPPLNRN